MDADLKWLQAIIDQFIPSATVNIPTIYREYAELHQPKDHELAIVSERTSLRYAHSPLGFPPNGAQGSLPWCHRVIRGTLFSKRAYLLLIPRIPRYLPHVGQVGYLVWHWHPKVTYLRLTHSA